MRGSLSFNPSSGNSSETPTPRAPVRQSSSAAQSEHGAAPPPSLPSDGTPRGGAPSPSTFNLLTREYAHAIRTTHVVDIMVQIQNFFASGAGDDSDEDGGAAAAPPQGVSRSAQLLEDVLQPNRGAVKAALSRVRSGRLSNLVSGYFDASESTSRLCLRLQGRVECARAIYAPLLELLDVLPSAATTACTTAASSPASIASLCSSQNRPPRRRSHHFLSPSQCEWAVQVFQEFYAKENPFSGAAGFIFTEMRRCLDALADELRACLRRARRRARLLPGGAACSAACLIGSALAITLGVLLATHALPAMGTALVGFLRCPADPLAGKKRRLREQIAQLEDAGKGVFVLNNHLDTVDRLVRRLYEAVEDDRVLVQNGLAVGGGDRRFIEALVRQLQRTRAELLKKLRELEDHVSLCFSAINSARNLLFEHINRRHGRRRTVAGSSDEQAS